MRQCSTCKAEKSCDQFQVDLTRSSGFRSQCRECVRIGARKFAGNNKAKRSAYAKQYRTLNKDRLDSKEAHRRLTKRAQALVAHARIRARRLRVPFALDDQVASIQAIIDQGYCELTGLAFDLTPGARQHLSPSLDRRVPSDGYVPGNVRVICYGMNAAMGNWGEAALVEMVTAYMDLIRLPPG